MKSTEFFIEKAESFLEQLRAFELVAYDFATAWGTNVTYNDIPTKSDDNSTFESQSEELQEIKFQMNLMLSEFDNGEVFIKRLNKSEKFSHDNQPKVDHLIKINKLFIDFLEEYRVEKK